MMNPRTWIGLGLVIGGTVGACYQYDPTYCGNLDGHSSCRELGLGQFCSLCDFEKDGCVDERPSADCLAPFEIPVESEGSSTGGGSDSGGTTGSSGFETGMGSEETSSSGGGCIGPEDCPASAPICGPGGQCVGCDAVDDPDAACAGLGGQTPLCVDDGCVSCTERDTAVCDGQLRLCDPATYACVDCTEHAQCQSGACRIDEGLCFPNDVVVHVDGDGGQDFNSVSDAIASFNNGALGVVVVHERVGDAPYLEATIDGGKILALVGAEGERPALLGTGVEPNLSVEGEGTTVYVESLILFGGVDFGMVCIGARVDLRRSRSVGNDGGGILAQGGCELSVENSFVGGTIDTDALDVQSSTVSVLYSTLAASASIAGSPAALRCDGASTVDVRNSILVGASIEPEVQCGGAMISYSAGEGALEGTGNAAVGEFDAGWFDDFVAGDFQLSASGGVAFADVARWEDGDPVTDIDETARPETPGTMDHAGADVP